LKLTPQDIDRELKSVAARSEQLKKVSVLLRRLEAWINLRNQPGERLLHLFSDSEPHLATEVSYRDSPEAHYRLCSDIIAGLEATLDREMKALRQLYNDTPTPIPEER
jgi:hypothetical protein